MPTITRSGLSILIVATIAGCQTGVSPVQIQEVERVSDQEGIVERAANLNESGQVALFASQTMIACHNVRANLPQLAASWEADQLEKLLTDGAVTTTTSGGLLPGALDSSAIVAQEFGRTMRYQASVPIRLAYIEAQSDSTRQAIAAFNCEDFSATVAEITEQKKNTADAWARGIKTVGYTILGGLALKGLDNVLTGAIAAAAQPSNSTVINGDNNATGTAGRDQNDVSVSTAGGIPVKETDLDVTASEGEATDETGTCPVGYSPVDDDGDGVVDRCSDGAGGSTDLL